MRYALVIIACLTSGCSLVWHSREPAIRYDVGQCPAPHWTYAIDLTLAAVAASAGTVVYTQNIVPSDLGIESDSPSIAISIPLFMIAGAFTASTLGGAGEVIRCNRREEWQSATNQ